MSSVANFQYPSDTSVVGSECTAELAYLDVQYRLMASSSTPRRARYSLDAPSLQSFLSSLLVKGAIGNIDSMQLVFPLLHSRNAAGLNAIYLWHFEVNYHVLGQVLYDIVLIFPLYILLLDF